jgi:hypothetical protein
MTAADRYVTTADIRAAVRGHETDILDGLAVERSEIGTASSPVA